MNGLGLVIADVHERVHLVEAILKRFLPLVSWVVFLGDYLDDWEKDPQRTLRAVHWLREALQDPRVHLMLGNHDMQYLWPQLGWFRCSYYEHTQKLVTAHLPEDQLRKLRDLRGRVVTQRHGRLLSHAGVHPYYLPKRRGFSMEWMALQETQAYRGLMGAAPSPTWLWNCGPDRGGWDRYGGPQWLDWRTFKDDLRLPPQIVGHSRGDRPRQKGRSLCLDTNSNHVALLAPDGSVEIQSTSGLEVAV